MKAGNTAIQVAEKQVKAARLRAQGWSYPQIGKALGVTGEQARQYVDSYFDASAKDKGSMQRWVEEARLAIEETHRLCFKAVIEADGSNTGQALNALIRAVEMRARAAGLIAPNQNIQVVQQEMSARTEIEALTDDDITAGINRSLSKLQAIAEDAHTESPGDNGGAPESGGPEGPEMETAG